MAVTQYHPASDLLGPLVDEFFRPQSGRGMLRAPEADVVETIATVMDRRPIRISLPAPLVRMAAHGTSDHAAAYAAYALRLLCGWTAMRESMTSRSTASG